MAQELDLHYKLYIPLEYLEDSEIVDIPKQVYLDIEKKLDNIAETYGGMTRYLAVGKYFNKEQHKVYDIDTMIIDIFINKEVELYFEIMAMDLLVYVKNTLHQECVAYEKSSNDNMYFI